MSSSTLIRQSIKPLDQRGSHLKLKIVALVASTFVSLAAGTPYLYGIYSPQLISRCQFTAADSSLLSFSSNIGSSIGGFLAGLFIDKFGPSYAVLLGAILESSGFLILYLNYRFKIHYFAYLVVAMLCVGFGSVLAYFATLKVATINFPNHRGAANAGPVSAYGLAALFYASMSTLFFKGNTMGLLKFISIFAGLVIGVASVFIGLHEHDSDDGGEDSVLTPGQRPPLYNKHHASGLPSSEESSSGMAYLLKGHRGSFAQVNLIRSNSSTSMFSTMSEASVTTLSTNSSSSQLSSLANNPIPINLPGSTTPTAARSYTESPLSLSGYALANPRSSGQISNLSSGSPVEFKSKQVFITRGNSMRNIQSLSNSPRTNIFGSFPKKPIREDAIIDEDTPLAAHNNNINDQQSQPMVNYNSLSSSPGWTDGSSSDNSPPHNRLSMSRQSSSGLLQDTSANSQLQQQHQQQLQFQPIDNTQLTELSNKKKKKHKSKRKLTSSSSSHILSLLNDKTFLAHFLLNAFYCATGQIYIYCVGFIVKAQLNNQNLNPSLMKISLGLFSSSDLASTKPDEDLSSSYQALQVSIISFSNFLGRLLSGPASDLLHKTLKMQRVWVIVISTAILGVGQLSLLLLNDINSLTLTSFLVGISYGSVYGTMPAIVADTFGSKSFATTWSLIGTGPITVFLLLSHYFGKVYDSNSSLLEDDSGELTKVCLRGKGCYDQVFVLTSGISAVLFCGYSLLIYVSRNTKHGR